ncbi:MAG: 3-deoxy-D-manno-octulosonic acid transferase [Planctomycetota bacterium]|jgi:3-deoxy-D-manno-octulosonic-acid transferase
MSRRPGIFFWFLLYNTILYLGVLVCLPFWLFVRLIRGRYRGQFRERMGILDPKVCARFRGRRAIWVHAASAGETVAAVPLVRALRQAIPDHPVLFTVTSRYGKEMAQRRLEGVADAVCFSPLDLPLFCRRFLDAFQPVLYVMVETDIWPNILRKCQRRGVPCALASGYASRRSFPRPFWRAVFTQIDLFLMQSEEDARNIVERGADPARVSVGGNMKFDSSTGAVPESKIPALRREFGLDDGGPVFVAGSTLAEDEAPVLDAIAGLRREGIDLHAIVAPRRQERVPDVVRELAERDLPAVRRTEGGSSVVLVLDTMGELASTYNLAGVAYVGGGFTPDVGLHSLIEPLVCGAPVLFGPQRGKAARVAAEVLRFGAGMEVADGAALLDAMRGILTDPDTTARFAEAGQRLLELHQGAAARQGKRIGELVTP